MKRKRRLRISGLIIIILIPLILIGILGYGFYFLFNINNNDQEDIVLNSKDDVSFDNIETLDLDLHSKEYLLIRLNDLEALYGEKYNNFIYPASLTKIMTLNTVLACFSDLNDTSSFTLEQYNELISENASLAGLMPNVLYTLKDLLYYLVLPSGADAALALENYFIKNNMNLIDEMNKRCEDLHLKKSHFTNSTGLHDDNLYTTLSDLSIIYIDTLKKDDGKQYLKTLYNSNLNLFSTLYPLSNRKDNIHIIGGKTGYTPEAKQNIICFYEVDNRSYILLLAGADGNQYLGEHYHFDDVNLILDYLYN